MKKNVLRSVLCLILLTAVLAAGVIGVNALTAPLVEAHQKALLGDAVLIYDRADPAASELNVTADTVQSVYKDDTKQVYTLHLSTANGWQPTPIGMTLVVDYEGRIVSLTVDDPGAETRMDELDKENFLPSFQGKDSALAGVELVAGTTMSSKAIRDAVNDGMDTMIANGLFAAGEKSPEQLLLELMPEVFPGIANKAGVAQAEELEGSGSVTKGYKALNGSGCAWIAVSGEETILVVVTPIGGTKAYNTAGEDVTASADKAVLEECAALSAANAEDQSAAQVKALSRMVPEGAELKPVEIPGLANSVTGAYTAETEDGVLYAFAARPYGYSNQVMEFYYVLDENGAIVDFRAAELILQSEYYSNYTLDEAAYKNGFIGLTEGSYSGEQAQITGATVTTGAADTAVRDVFEAFALLMGNRG